MQQDASHGLRNTERQQVYQDVYGCICAMKGRNISRVTPITLMLNCPLLSVADALVYTPHRPYLAEMPDVGQTIA